MERLRANGHRRQSSHRAGGSRRAGGARSGHGGGALTLQRQVGNQAVASLLAGDGPAALQRKAGADGAPPRPRLGRGWERSSDGTYFATDIYDAVRSPIPAYPKGTDIRAALAARPQLLEILTATELDQWQATVDRATAWRERTKLSQAILRDSPLMVQSEDYQAWERRADAKLPPPGPPGGKLMIPVERFLDPTILQPAYDVQAELAFRQWAIARLASGPIEITLIDPDTTDLRFASQLLPTDGRITADALESIFPDEYRKQVTQRPALEQLRELVHELFTVWYDLDPEFQERLRKNEKYSGGLAFVRYWSEWLGEGSTDMPDIAEWNGPFYMALQPGANFLREGKVELAVPLIVSAELQMADVVDRFLKYEHRVTTGAGVAVKWLERVKVAGSIAATIASGPLGLSRAALITGAYAGTQNVAQQASEVALGQRASIDIGAAAREAAVSAGMAMIAMPLQARFQARILQSVVGREALEAGVSATVLEQRIASSLAGATTAVYTAPLQVVMSNVIQGKAMPKSMDELCDLILDEALKSAAMNPITDRLTHDIVKLKAERAGQKADEAARRPLDQRTTEDLGSRLRTLGDPGGGPDPAGSPDPAAASDPDAAATKTKDAADTRDPTKEVGLASHDAMKRVALDLHAVGGAKGTPRMSERAIREVASRILESIARELPSGMPPPKLVLKNLGTPRTFGTYGKSKHTITVNMDAMVTTTSGAKEPAFATSGPGFERLLGLLYHEARHAEQTFYALRVKAGTSPDLDKRMAAQALADGFKVDADLARAAVDRPIDPNDTSREAALGRDIWAESFEKGTRKDLRDWAQRAIGESHGRRAEIDQLQAYLADLYTRNQGQRTPEWWQVWQYASDIEKHITNVAETYMNLAEEIDARRTGNTMEKLFQLGLRAQLELNGARQKLAAAEKALAKIPEAELDAATKALVLALKYQRRIEEWTAALAATLPREPTGAGRTR